MHHKKLLPLFLAAVMMSSTVTPAMAVENSVAVSETEAINGEDSEIASEAETAAETTEEEKAVVNETDGADKEEAVAENNTSDGAFGEEIEKHLREYRAEVIVLAGFLSKLPEQICDEYSGRILNVHPALIPSFCGKGFYGLNVHKAALEYGVKVSGATVHLVDSEYDHGRILLQKAVDVLPDDTPESLQQRIMIQAEHIILPQAVEMICSETIKNKQTV